MSFAEIIIVFEFADASIERYLHVCVKHQQVFCGVLSLYYILNRVFVNSIERMRRKRKDERRKDLIDL